MKKRNIRGFFVGEKGQRLFNYAYSIGASIVILGALFKLLHAPMADFILIIGMGTEAVIFFLSAFDEPAKDYKWEKVYPELDIPNEEEAAIARLERIKEGVNTDAPVAASSVTATPSVNTASAANSIVASNIAPLNVNTEEVNDATQKYVEQLKSISEQMTALNRSVQGLDAIYEVQLKSASSQLGSVEQVTEQTKQLVQNLQQLNELYGRMISAMAPSQQK